LCAWDYRARTRAARSFKEIEIEILLHQYWQIGPIVV
jgi:hypothetical protein